MKIKMSSLFAAATSLALLYTLHSALRETAHLSWPMTQARITKVEWKPIGKHDTNPVCCVPLLYLNVEGRQVLASPFRRYTTDEERAEFTRKMEGTSLTVQVNPTDEDELILEPGISAENFAHTLAGTGVFLVLLVLTILYYILERKHLTQP